MKNPILQSRNLKLCKANIDEVMDNFNFQRVHEVMKFLNWTWAFDPVPPSVDQIKEFLLNYLESAAQEDGAYEVSCGGFIVRKTADNNFDVAFSISSWETLS